MRRNPSPTSNAAIVAASFQLKRVRRKSNAASLAEQANPRAKRAVRKTSEVVDVSTLYVCDATD
jgi:hypothetical protein